MVSFDQESTAGRVPSRTGRWSEYTNLSRQIKQAGLLDRRRGYYAAKIVLGDSWWQLLTAAYLAVVFTQLAFVGHDAGHRQIFRSRRANDLVGLLHANLLVGVSFGWWVPKHNRHHSNPTHDDLDPDIGIAALAFTTGQARHKRGPFQVIARYQAYLFFPLLLLEAAHLHVAGYLTTLLLVLSPLQAVAFLLGGLNYQIEHHLVPNMPRPDLRHAQRLVRAFCRQHDISYTEATMFGSYAEALRPAVAK
jgi:fatty acid desaturase